MPMFRDGAYYGQFVVEPGPAAAQYIVVGDAAGHFGAGGNLPTVTTLAANGTAASTTPVFLAGSSDVRGQISFGSGTGGTGGEQIRVTFNQPFASIPYVNLTIVYGATGATTSGLAGVANPGPLFLGVGTVGTTGFSIATSTLTASLASGAIPVNYWVCF